MDLERTSGVVPQLNTVATIYKVGGSCGICSLNGVCSTAAKVVMGVASGGGVAMDCLLSAIMRPLW